LRVLLIVGLLGLALGLRVGEVERTPYRPINDAGSYLTLAAQIAHTGGYSTSRRPGTGAGGTRGPSAYFPPGFPYFLAAVDLIDGHRAPRDGAISPARLSQAALGTATVGLVGLLALEAFGPAAALAALALAALYPVLIELSGVLVAENLFTALVVASLYALLRARRARRPYAWIALAGGLAGLATLTHVNGVVMLVVALIGALAVRRTVSAPAVVVASFVAVLAPWTVRNYEQLHRFIPVSDETGMTLVGTYNKASAADRAIPYKWRIYYEIPGERALVRKSAHLTEPALNSRLEHQALHYIGAHPLAPLAVLGHNSLRLLELEGSFAWRASAAAISIPAGTAEIGVLSFWALCLLALAGAFTRVARRAPLWLWSAPALLWISVALVNAETPRFREPVDPFLLMLAGCALLAAVHPSGLARQLLARVGRRRWRLEAASASRCASA
jgi:4-amino-4-deoxy-L-arabinose transferase-like glycosyltransferase